MRVRWAIGVLAAALLLAPTASAEDGLTFPVSKPVTVSAGKAAKLELCNTGASPVTALVFRLEGFDFATRPGVDPERVLAVSSNLKKIEKNTCADVTLTVMSGSLLPGSYAGSVVVSSDQGVVVRPATVLEPGVPGDAAGGVAEVALDAGHAPFRRHATLTGNASIALGPYPRRTAAVRPLTGVVAILENNGHRARLVSAADPNDELPVENRFANLPVKLEGARHTGTYKGSTSLGGRKVAFTVRVGDAWYWCLLAVVGGIALAVAAALVSQLAFPWRRLRRFQWNLVDDIDYAVGWYNGRRGAESRLPELSTDRDASTKYGDSVWTSFKRYLRKTLLVDPASEDYKAIRKLVDDAQDDLRFIQAPDGLVVTLRGLLAAADKFPGDLPWPAFVHDVRQLFEPRAVGPGGGAKLAAHAAAYTDLLERWPSLWGRLRGYVSWRDEIFLRVGSGPVADVTAMLRRAEYELLAPRDLAEFTSANAERRLERAYRELSRLGWIYHPPAPAEPEPQLALATGGAVVMALNAIDPTQAAARLAQPVIHFVERARAAVLAPASALVPPSRAGALVGPAAFALVILLALATSVVTVFTTIYSPTFGSVGDYLQAGGLGSAAGVGSKAILDSIAGVRKLAP